jgi:hypothetical protein
MIKWWLPIKPMNQKQAIKLLRTYENMGGGEAGKFLTRNGI